MLRFITRRRSRMADSASLDGRTLKKNQEIS